MHSLFGGLELPYPHPFPVIKCDDDLIAPLRFPFSFFITTAPASSIKVCSRNDPELSRCVIEAVNDLRPRLATGKISDQFQIPPLEPLALATVNMDRGAELKATFSELLVSGPSKFKIDNLK